MNHLYIPTVLLLHLVHCLTCSIIVCIQQWPALSSTLCVECVCVCMCIFVTYKPLFFSIPLYRVHCVINQLNSCHLLLLLSLSLRNFGCKDKRVEYVRSCLTQCNDAVNGYIYGHWLLYDVVTIRQQ